MKRFFQLFILLWALPALAGGTVPLIPTFGQELFAPSRDIYTGSGSSILWISNGVLIADSGGEPLLSVTASWGRSMTTGIMEMGMRQIATYTNEVVAGYSNWVACHSGPWSRHQDEQNFAGAALIACATNNFQTIDRVSSTEYITQIPNVSIGLGSNYVIQTINTSGNAYLDRWMNPDRSIIYSTSGTFQTGVAASGYQSLHSYDAGMAVTWCSIWDAASNIVVDPLTMFVNPLANSEIGGAVITNGVLQLYSDGTGGTTASAWRYLESPIVAQNFQLDGVLNCVSGGSGGICFRCDLSGMGYNCVFDKASAKMLLYAGSPLSTPTLLNSLSVALPATTNYPFTLIVKSNVITWNLAGNSMATTDNTYGGAGVSGVGGK